MDNYKSGLSDVLRRLAAEAPEQQTYLQKIDVDADELALEYDDLFRLADGGGATEKSRRTNTKR